MHPNQILYQLTLEDLQNVANQTLERDLTATEIANIEPHIGNYINWFDALQSAINATIPTQQQ